uniref:Uncharacterized protein n=1 Tax=Oryza rufipogon TaxID=4529 RepID=A0A0E0PD17_ORYRU
MDQLEAAKMRETLARSSYTRTGASRTAAHGPADRQRESHARMGVPRRTSPAGTIQRRAFAGWNASAHHTSSAAPPRPTATRLAAVAARDDHRVVSAGGATPPAATAWKASALW